MTTQTTSFGHRIHFWFLASIGLLELAVITAGMVDSCRFGRPRCYWPLAAFALAISLFAVETALAVSTLWHRRRFTIGLRSLCLHTAMIWIPLAWFVGCVWHARELETALQRMTDIDLVDSGQYKQARIADFVVMERGEALARSLCPRQFVEYAGNLFFGDVDSIFVNFREFAGRIPMFPRLRRLEIHDPNWNDDDTIHLAGLAQLERLSLNRTDISNTSLRTIVGLPNLRQLLLEETSLTDADLSILGSSRITAVSLADTNVSDVGVEQLARVQTLRAVSLARTRITDQGVAALGELDLHTLVLDETNIGDQALRGVSRCRSLKELSINKTQVSDEGLAFLSGQSIEWLRMAECAVTDRGLRHIATLPSLQELTLSGTRITDDGVEALGNCRELIHLDVDRTSVTMAGLAKLHARQSMAVVKDMWITFLEGESPSSMSTRLFLQPPYTEGIPRFFIPERPFGLAH